MNIDYKDIHEFSKDDLEDLFLSVEWSSGHYPDKLVIAMQNFKAVYSAWDGEKLVGMACAMDDGIMNAYKFVRWYDVVIMDKNIGLAKREMGEVLRFEDVRERFGV